VRGAAGSLRGAALAMQRQPPPEPKHRGRKILGAGTLIAAVVFLARWASSSANGGGPDGQFAARSL